MYLYHVLCIAINICGIDCKKMSVSLARKQDRRERRIRLQEYGISMPKINMARNSQFKNIYFDENTLASIIADSVAIRTR